MAQSSPAEPSQPSPIFARAVERFNTILTEKQKRQFKACSLEDVQKTALELQKRRENPKALRNMARLQAFLEGMDEYRKVVQAFLNCTPFLGYAWVSVSMRSRMVDRCSLTPPIHYIGSDTIRIIGLFGQH